MIRNILSLMLLSFVLSSCKKDEPMVSAVPKIEFISISPSEVEEYKEEIVIKIAYLDGDGDLGENNPDVTNLFVVDTRNYITYKFRVRQLSPDNSNIAIRGNLSIVLSNTAITDGSTAQSVSYHVYVKDRAGNISNLVLTNPVNVSK